MAVEPVVRILKKKRGDRSDEKDWKTVMIARQRERERDGQRTLGNLALSV